MASAVDMNAFDRLIANSAATPDSGETGSSSSNKHEARYELLNKRRNKALKDTKGFAKWWKWLIPCLTLDSDTDERSGVYLQCSLCEAHLSATNESRIATSHFKNAACKAIKSDPVVAAEIAAAFVNKPAESAAAQIDAADDVEILETLSTKKRKADSQSCLETFYLSMDKQKELTQTLYDFFLEASDCVAMHACEHPSLKRLCVQIGIKPLNRKALAGPVLERKYKASVADLDQRLSSQSMEYSLALMAGSARTSMTLRKYRTGWAFLRTVDQHFWVSMILMGLAWTTLSMSAF